MDVEKIKNRLKIDHSEDDNLLTDLYQSAEFYIRTSVDSSLKTEDFSDVPIFEHAILLLVGHWYENRLAMSQDKSEEIPYGVLPLIQKMRGLNYENKTTEK